MDAYHFNCYRTPIQIYTERPFFFVLLEIYIRDAGASSIVINQLASNQLIYTNNNNETSIDRLLPFNNET